MNNTGISLTEACKTAYSQLSDEQKASCPGVMDTSSYLQWAAVPVVIVIVLAVVCVVVFSRKQSGD